LADRRIEGAVDYQFRVATILAAGDYLVVAADPLQLAAAVDAAHLLGPWQGNLANDERRSKVHSARSSSRMQAGGPVLRCFRTRLRIQFGQPRGSADPPC
jgi:hypothetical protein